MSIANVARAIRRPHANETLDRFVTRVLASNVIGRALDGDETVRGRTRVGERNQIANAIMERYGSSVAAEAIADMLRDPAQDAAAIRSAARALISAERVNTQAADPSAALTSPSHLRSLRDSLARITHREAYGSINSMITQLNTLLDEAGSATWTRDQTITYLRSHAVDATWVSILRTCSAADAQTLAREVFTSRDYDRRLDYSIWRTLFALQLHTPGHQDAAAVSGRRLLSLLNDRNTPNRLGTIDRTQALLNIPREDAFVREAITALRVGASVTEMTDPWLARHSFAPDTTVEEQTASIERAIAEAARLPR